MDTKFPFQLSIRPPARAVSSTEHVLHLNVKRRRLSPSRAWLVRITTHSEVILLVLRNGPEVRFWEVSNYRGRVGQVLVTVRYGVSKFGSLQVNRTN